MGRIKLKADPEAIAAVTAFVEEACGAAGVGQADLYEVLLIVDELVANVCRYAYPGAEGDLEVEIGFEGALCTLRFRDSGIPFDPTRLEAPDATGSVEDRKIGGFGIYFIRQKSERFDYARQGGRNVVTVVKRVSR